ncbi:hypothetical protein NXS19_002933 [Fusarium pseudograminearum]|nr:hypothetical protein NXS19_002933 [Fusarium pseudograminearum]
MASTPEMATLASDAKKPTLDQSQDQSSVIQHVENSEFEENPKVAWSTILAVFFMGLTYIPAIATAFLMPTQIIQQIGRDLGDTDNIAWIPGGWSIGAAVSFILRCWRPERRLWSTMGSFERPDYHPGRCNRLRSC